MSWQSDLTDTFAADIEFKPVKRPLGCSGRLTPAVTRSLTCC
jgi:hypothetical protein